MSLSSASPRLLLPARAASAAAADRAAAAAVAVDVLAAEGEAELAEAVARAARLARKAEATDLALAAIVAKLKALPAGGGRLDHLLLVVARLDPDSDGSESEAVRRVELVLRRE